MRGRWNSEQNRGRGVATAAKRLARRLVRASPFEGLLLELIGTCLGADFV